MNANINDCLNQISLLVLNEPRQSALSGVLPATDNWSSSTPFESYGSSTQSAPELWPLQRQSNVCVSRVKKNRKRCISVCNEMPGKRIKCAMELAELPECSSNLIEMDIGYEADDEQ